MIEFYQDSSHLWRWRLVARNGRIMADSGEGYSTRTNAKHAFTRVSEMFANALWIK